MTMMAMSSMKILCLKILVSAGQKFPETVSAILKRLQLYSRGMTGWGKDHAGVAPLSPVKLNIY